MKNKLKGIIVISLIFTVVLGMLPTNKVYAITEDESKVVYLEYIKRFLEASNNSGKENVKKVEELQFNCLNGMLEAWYLTDKNADKLTVAEKKETITNNGQEQEKVIYKLQDEEGDQVGIIRTILNTDIMLAVGNETLEINKNGKVSKINASMALSYMMTSQGKNQMFNLNEKYLENYMIKRIKPDAPVETKFVSSEDVINTGAIENVGMVLSGIARTLWYPIKVLVFLLPGLMIQMILEGIASVGGLSNEITTLEGILTNKIPVANINIFNSQNSTGVLGLIRGNIASWYMAFRNLAIVIQLCTLIYIGIRMAISSLGEQRARYKEMLKNWIVGLTMIFLLHYFMVAILNFSEVLAKVISQSMTIDESYQGLLNQLLKNSFKLNIIKSTTAAMCFVMLEGLTFGFLMMYIKRMLTISLLTCVAPLVTTTYAMDKLGDRKSQILDTWVREYSFNALIQPFHCIIYIVFVKNAIDILEKTPTSFAGAIIAVMCMSFMFIAESIVKAIFGLKGNTVRSAAMSIAAVTAGITATASIGSKVKNAEMIIKRNMESQKKMAEKMPKIDNKVTDQNTRNKRKSDGNRKQSCKRCRKSSRRIKEVIFKS